MASKWKKLKGKIPDLPVETDWQVKVDVVKETYKTFDLSKLTDEFDSLRESKDRLETRIKILNINLEALSQLLLDKMEFQDLDSFSVHGATFYLNVEPYSRIVDNEKLAAWVDKTKQRGIMRVPWQTLNAIVKDMLVNGKPAPPGVEVFLKTSVRRREVAA